MNANHPCLIHTNALILASVINRDGPEKWKSMLEPMIGWMNNEQQNNIKAGLDTFCYIFNNVDDRIHIIVPGIMNQLYQIYTKPESDETIRKRVLMLLYLCFTKFSWAQGVQDDIIEKC